MALTCHVTGGVHRDGKTRYSAIVEETNTNEVICVVISEEEITADLNAQQLMKLIGHLTGQATVATAPPASDAKN